MPEEYFLPWLDEIKEHMDEFMEAEDADRFEESDGEEVDLAAALIDGVESVNIYESQVSRDKKKAEKKEPEERDVTPPELVIFQLYTFVLATTLSTFWQPSLHFGNPLATLLLDQLIDTLWLHVTSVLPCVLQSSPLHCIPFSCCTIESYCRRRCCCHGSIATFMNCMFCCSCC